MYGALNTTGNSSQGTVDKVKTGTRFLVQGKEDKVSGTGCQVPGAR